MAPQGSRAEGALCFGGGGESGWAEGSEGVGESVDAPGAKSQGDELGPDEGADRDCLVLDRGSRKVVEGFDDADWWLALVEDPGREGGACLGGDLSRPGESGELIRWRDHSHGTSQQVPDRVA